MRALIYLKYYGQRVSLALALFFALFGVGFDNNAFKLLAIASILLCMGLFKFKPEY